MKIGIFDSGLGGLTVLKQFLENLPPNEYYYFGDNARVPYGNKSEKMVTHFSHQAFNFLKSKDIELFVIACNTSSAVALQSLKSVNPNFPIIGMIEPAVTYSLSQSPTKRIGVIGTDATINSRAYENKLNQKAKNILAKSCPLFVPFVESAMIEHKALDLIIEEYLVGFKDNIDTLILACTHYPFLKKQISKFFDDKINIIDTGYAASLEAKQLITNTINEAKIEYFVSDKPNNFIQIAKKYLDLEIDKIEQIDIEKW